MSLNPTRASYISGKEIKLYTLTQTQFLCNFRNFIHYSVCVAVSFVYVGGCMLADRSSITPAVPLQCVTSCQTHEREREQKVVFQKQG